jgi:FkbM family methyltransferase
MNGLKLRMPDSGSIAIFSSSSEPFMRYWFRPQLGQTVLDIGAHIGKYTLQFSRAVGSTGRVISVEPHPENYAMLLENLRLNDARNVRPVKCAVWNKPLYIGLFIGEGSGLHSLKVNHKHGTIQVQAKTVDDLLKELDVDWVDWMKIDVEGAEADVLEGANRTIAKCKPKIVLEIRQFEVNQLKSIAAAQDYGIVEIQSLSPTDPMWTGYWFLTPLRGR